MTQANPKATDNEWQTSYAVAKQSDGDKDPWEDVRRAVYAPLKSKDSKGPRRTRLLAYIESLARAARQGDVDAASQQSKMMMYLDKKKEQEKGAVGSEAGRLAFQQRLDKQARIAPLGLRYSSLAYALVVRRLTEEHVKNHGSLPDKPFSSAHPALDLSHGQKLVQFIDKQVERTSRQDDAPECGYGKPPVATRWKAKQSGNPSGKRKVTGDGWDEFRSGLLKRVPVILEGRKTKLSSAAITTAKVFELAIKGDRKARREVHRLLVALDKRKLLSPPPSRPRRSRGKPAPLEWKCLALDFAIVDTKQRMHADFRRVYGPDEQFFENIKRERQELLTKLRALRSAIKEAA